MHRDADFCVIGKSEPHIHSYLKSKESKVQANGFDPDVQW